MTDQLKSEPLTDAQLRDLLKRDIETMWRGTRAGDLSAAKLAENDVMAGILYTFVRCERHLNRIATALESRETRERRGL